MKTVWKIGLTETGEPQERMLPHDAEILHVSNQHGKVTLWALVEDSEPDEERLFIITGTGHLIPENGEYLGTALIGNFVWHVWELR